MVKTFDNGELYFPSFSTREELQQFITKEIVNNKNFEILSIQNREKLLSLSSEEFQMNRRITFPTYCVNSTSSRNYTPFEFRVRIAESPGLPTFGLEEVIVFYTTLNDETYINRQIDLKNIWEQKYKPVVEELLTRKEMFREISWRFWRERRWLEDYRTENFYHYRECPLFSFTKHSLDEDYDVAKTCNLYQLLLAGAKFGIGEMVEIRLGNYSDRYWRSFKSAHGLYSASQSRPGAYFSKKRSTHPPAQSGIYCVVLSQTAINQEINNTRKAKRYNVISLNNFKKFVAEERHMFPVKISKEQLRTLQERDILRRNSRGK